MSKRYDYLIVGAGLFGATCAYLLKQAGKKVVVIDTRNHIAGNCFTKNVHSIMVHKYGAHIFHTSNEEVWKFVNQFSKFNNFVNSPLAYYHGELYNLPFNMNTFHQIWPDVITPEQAKQKIVEETTVLYANPQNLEEQAIKFVGPTIYKKLIKEYTEKQWGTDCTKLSPTIIKRLPLRFTYDNNYFNDRYQGIPENGYTRLINNMLKDILVILEADYCQDRKAYDSSAKKVIYTGSVDRLCNYKFGKLDYRTVEFETKIVHKEDYQGNAVVNYTSHEVPFTRIIEHKHFNNKHTSKETVISFEFSKMSDAEHNPCYPINNIKNTLLYNKYFNMIAKEMPNIILGGRLGLYKYLDMDKTIEEAMKLVRSLV